MTAALDVPAGAGAVLDAFTGAATGAALDGAATEVAGGGVEGTDLYNTRQISVQSQQATGRPV